MRKNIVSPFIQMLWDIVTDPTTDSSIIWNQNGTSFQIISPTMFAQNILAKYYKHTNISSFVRQLNMYNFHKNKGNTKSLEFYHKLFRRDAKEILIGIKRKPSQADTQYGQELLKNFLNQKKSDCKPTQSTQFAPQRQQASEQTDNQFVYQHQTIKSRVSAFTQQFQIPNIYLLQNNELLLPKIIKNIIIIPISQSPN